MGFINFAQGNKENYNAQEMQGTIYLSGDSKELLFNDKSYGNATPADEEDITAESGNLKLKDRSYDEASFSGKGYVILRKNISEGKNILTQEMINQPNTIYEIRYDFDLNGVNITIPENCVLKFKGGSISNGSVNLNRCSILSKGKVFNNVNILDASRQTWSAEWFSNQYEDISQILQNIIDNTSVQTIAFIFNEGSYIVHDLDMSDSTATTIIFKSVPSCVNEYNTTLYCMYESVNTNFNYFITSTKNLTIKLENIQILSQVSIHSIQQYSGYCIYGMGNETNLHSQYSLIGGFQYGFYADQYASNTKCYNTIMTTCVYGWYFNNTSHTLQLVNCSVNEVAYGITLTHGGTNDYIKNLHCSLAYFGNDWENLISTIEDFYCIKLDSPTQLGLTLDGIYYEEYNPGYHAENYCVIKLLNCPENYVSAVLKNCILSKPSANGGKALELNGASNNAGIKGGVILENCNVTNWDLIKTYIDDPNYHTGFYGLIVDNQVAAYQKNGLFTGYMPDLSLYGKLKYSAPNIEFESIENEDLLSQNGFVGGDDLYSGILNKRLIKLHNRLYKSFNISLHIEGTFTYSNQINTENLNILLYKDFAETIATIPLNITYLGNNIYTLKVDYQGYFQVTDQAVNNLELRVEGDTNFFYYVLPYCYGRWSYQLAEHSPLKLSSEGNTSLRINETTYGSSDKRPALSQDNVGFQYFDTTLGKMIQWNGTAWVDADGNNPDEEQSNWALIE